MLCAERSPTLEGGQAEERTSPSTEDFRAVMAKRKVAFPIAAIHSILSKAIGRRLKQRQQSEARRVSDTCHPCQGL